MLSWLNSSSRPAFLPAVLLGHIRSILPLERSRRFNAVKSGVRAEGTAMAPRAERKLAAILAADVVGYGRLVGYDEAGTIARLKALREELIEPLIADYRGRVVKLMGDGALVEFASAVDAVECAVAVQRGVTELEVAEPEDRRIAFRIGINLGDVIVEGDDIFGDGVNIAVRLQSLAEPGGICVSAVVREQVRDKLDAEFSDLGEQTVKNIARPLHIYRLEIAPRSRPSRSARPSLPLPDKPSIAVLPFTNMSGNPEQDYFADGMVEDIITGLSRIKWLFVIARNSTFAYKGKVIDVKRVGRDLGVRYLLEGRCAQIDQSCPRHRSAD